MKSVTGSGGPVVAGITFRGDCGLWPLVMWWRDEALIVSMVINHSVF